MTDQTPKPGVPVPEHEALSWLALLSNSSASAGAVPRRADDYHAAPAEPPTRIECAHGHLRRKCYTCDLEEERAALRAEVERLRGLEADYHRIVGELIPIAQPASGRPDDQLEPPWEVVARLRAEVERLRAALQKAVDDYGQPGGPWNVPREPGTWITLAIDALEGK